jgi:hypothetical protein
MGTVESVTIDHDWSWDHFKGMGPSAIRILRTLKTNIEEHGAIEYMKHEGRRCRIAGINIKKGHSGYEVIIIMNSYYIDPSARCEFYVS